MIASRPWRRAPDHAGTCIVDANGQTVCRLNGVRWEDWAHMLECVNAIHEIERTGSSQMILPSEVEFYRHERTKLNREHFSQAASGTPGATITVVNHRKREAGEVVAGERGEDEPRAARQSHGLLRRFDQAVRRWCAAFDINC